MLYPTPIPNNHVTVSHRTPCTSTNQPATIALSPSPTTSPLLQQAIQELNDSIYYPNKAITSSSISLRCRFIVSSRAPTFGSSPATASMRQHLNFLHQPCLLRLLDLLLCHSRVLRELRFPRYSDIVCLPRQIRQSSLLLLPPPVSDFLNSLISLLCQLRLLIPSAVLRPAHLSRQPRRRFLRGARCDGDDGLFPDCRGKGQRG